ncbi:aldehyde-activating protein [Bradyrhizobium sp. CSA112]|nr:aldehyde-activating protein [Bradyrhizobium sp. CSA112]
MSQGFTGGCLCGAVRFKSTADAQMVGHCHCIDCRKSSGTGHCTHLVVPEQAFYVTGSVTLYDRAADSGNIISRGFCGTCGSPIYSKNSGMPGVVFPRASVLDDPEIAKPQMVVYASRAPSWDHVNPALPVFATMPEGGPQKVIAAKSAS